MNTHAGTPIRRHEGLSFLYTLRGVPSLTIGHSVVLLMFILTFYTWTDENTVTQYRLPYDEVSRRRTTFYTGTETLDLVLHPKNISLVSASHFSLFQPYLVASWPRPRWVHSLSGSLRPSWQSPPGLVAVHRLWFLSSPSCSTSPGPSGNGKERLQMQLYKGKISTTVKRILALF